LGIGRFRAGELRDRAAYSLGLGKLGDGVFDTIQPCRYVFLASRVFGSGPVDPGGILAQASLDDEKGFLKVIIGGVMGVFTPGL
jgi:hypothetical protein